MNRATSSSGPWKRPAAGGFRPIAAFVAALSLAIAAAPPAVGSPPEDLPPIPDRVAVLTFDDSVKSHATFVGPLLKRLGFGATFFVTEGFDFETNKTLYMTWEEIAGLHADGFEIGNHTRRHANAADQSDEEFLADLRGIEERCAERGIPRPTSFAWPGNSIGPRALATLEREGYRFARRGGAPEFPYEQGRGRGYDPAEDHPLLIPSAGDARPFWTMEDFEAAIAQARDGRIAVLQFHGVPDVQHPWVHTDPAFFERCMNRLKEEGFAVLALRDLARFVDPDRKPADPFAAIERRAAKAE